MITKIQVIAVYGSRIIVNGKYTLKSSAETRI